MYKAIETHYKGFLFRSRLEARWAVFFDKIGALWRYEHEGFDLDGIRYLPDFFFTRGKFWVEIKPTLPTHEEREKAIRLCLATQQLVALFTGDVWPDVKGFCFESLRTDITPEELVRGFAHYPQKIHWLSTSEFLAEDRYGDAWGFNLHRGFQWCTVHWGQCPQCNAFGLVSRNLGPCTCENVEYEPQNERLMEAYTAARQARFDGRGEP